MLTSYNGSKVYSECGTAKTSNAEGTRFATVPQIRMSGIPQVRVGVVGRAMCYAKIALGLALCNYLTVTGTIILELHSNVYDYLY